MTRLLRFSDLQERGIVRSYVQLDRMQRLYSFPPGRLITPNSRAWTEEEVDAWLASRPVENDAPLKGAAKARHESRKARDREVA